MQPLRRPGKAKDLGYLARRLSARPCISQAERSGEACRRYEDLFVRVPQPFVEGEAELGGALSNCLGPRAAVASHRRVGPSRPWLGRRHRQAATEARAQ